MPALVELSLRMQSLQRHRQFAQARAASGQLLRDPALQASGQGFQAQA